MATSTWHPDRAAFPGARSLGVARPRGHALRRWPAVVIGLVCLAATSWWVTNSRVFDARTLRVTGNAHLSSDEVLRLAAVGRGSNVLWMSLDDVERRLERHPWILAAHVTRTLPSAVTIVLEERSPVAVTSGSRPVLVAADGIILGRAGPSVRLPRIDVAGKPVPGSRVAPSGAQLTVARALSTALSEKVDRISVEGSGEVTLSLRSGVRVLFGEADDAEAKAEALEGVLSWAQRKGITPQYIDVRVPAAPALGT